MRRIRCFFRRLWVRLTDPWQRVMYIHTDATGKRETISQDEFIRIWNDSLEDMKIKPEKR